MEPIKPYKKEFDYSYALGAFPTMELLTKRPESAEAVYVHSSFTDRARVEEVCGRHGIPVREGDKLIARLSDKENVYVIGQTPTKPTQSSSLLSRSSRGLMVLSGKKVALPPSVAFR